MKLKRTSEKLLSMLLSVAMAASLFSASLTAVFALDNEGGTEPAATIGENAYPTLQEAVEDAEDGDVITLVRDLVFEFAEDEVIDIDGKAVSIDFNGYGISVNEHLFRRKGLSSS